MLAPQAKRILPFPEVEHLTDLARGLSLVPPSQKEQLANECLDPQFVAALRQAFHTAEDSGKETELLMLFRIAKGVFMLGNHNLTKRYLRQDMFEDTMGMLEYDEGVPPEKRVPHRQVLKVAIRFKQVLSFQDAEMLKLVHLNYRLQYVKDYVLARWLDDAAFASLTQLVIFNNTSLLDYLRQSDPLIQQLFDGLRNKDTQSLLFLQDACRLAKTMPQSERKLLYDKMMQNRLFSVLLQFLSEESEPKDSTEGPVPRHLAMEVLVQSTLSDAGHLRRFLLGGGQEEGSVLLGHLICLLLADPDHGVQSQVADILQLVMDPTQVAQKSRAHFLDALYEHGVVDFIAKPLIDIAESFNVGGQLQQLCDGDDPLQGWSEDCPRLSPSGAYAVQAICELLAFAVMSHGQRPERLIKEQNLACKAVFVAAATGQRYLQLAPIRLVKAMVKAQDHIYLYHMNDTGLFGLLLKTVEQSLRPPALGGGLLASATSDLLEIIRLQNAKPLVNDLCSKYEGTLRALTPVVKVADGLLERYWANKAEAARAPGRQLRRTLPFSAEEAEGASIDDADVGPRAPSHTAGEDVLAGKDFSEIFGAEAESDSSDSSDSTVSEDEEEEVAEEDEEEDTSDEESNELSPVVEVVAAETAESRPPGGPQEVSETGMSPAPPGEKTSPPEVMSNEVVQRKRHESLDEDEAPSDGRSEPEKAEKPTQSRGLSSAARAAIRHHASRCRLNKHLAGPRVRHHRSRRRNLRIGR
ncbi:unnamed protein product [Durusdinium trenchii]|uniref:Serine/threonine-protein phosphatase 4 regulatory subunit 3-like central domain-containing protein n=1 Tax=Durusdinium trenchii TaxID=1381693 RepID=A0ABP0IBH7_9DINO